MNTRTDLTNINEAETTYGSGAYSPVDMALVRGQGTRVWDANGTEYIDCGTGIGVAALGHAHPALIEAVSDQAPTATSTTTFAVGSTKNWQ